MHHSKKFLTVAVCGFVLAVAASANAQIVLDDNFNRAAGNLVGTFPTPGPGGVWVAHSGAGSVPLQITSGAVVVSHGAGSREDANSSFGLYSVGALSAVFDINVSATAPIAGGDYEYFAHFSDGGTFNFKSRLDVVEANTPGNDYTLGLATGAGTAETIFPIDFSFGSPVTVNLTFDFFTGLSYLSVGATTIQSTGVFPGEALSAFCLRQSTSSNNETILVDNLVITVIPEPTSLSLLGAFGLLALTVIRRRK